MDKAVNEKKRWYAENGVELSYEDALDEIIADSTYEMVQDEAFVNELCRSHRGIAQSILDAIKAVLKKLRAVLAEGEGFTPKQNAALLSNLDILKDAERLWADGLMKAAENRDAVGMAGIAPHVKSSMIEFPTLNNRKAVFVDTDQHIFEGHEESEYPAIVKNYLKKKYMGTVVGTVNKAYINSMSAGEFAYPAKSLSGENLSAKMKAAPELENIMNTATDKRTEHYNYENPNPYHPERFKKDSSYTEGWEFYTTLFIVDDKAFEGVINIKLLKKGKLFKDITQIKNITDDISDSNGKLPLFRTISDINNSIFDSDENNNRKYSIGYTQDNRAVVIIENDILEGVPKERWISTVKKRTERI